MGGSVPASPGGPSGDREALRPRAPGGAAPSTAVRSAGRATARLPEHLATPLLALSFAVLLAVGLLGPNAAKPGLGERGWAPGDLPWSPSSGLVTGLLWAAYVAGGLGVALALRGPTTSPTRWRVPLALAALALLTGPFGSADHTNYAAYGRIAAQGGDPYLVPPDAWAGGADPVTSAVEPPWTETVSIYGPFATLMQLVSSLVGGDNLRQTVWVWQVLVVVAWLAVRHLLLRLASGAGTGATGVDAAAGSARARSIGRVDVLWTLNPLVFGLGVLGAHVDLVAAALAVAAMAVAARSPLAAGALSGLAVSTKVTYGVVVLALGIAWLAHHQASVRRALALAAGLLVVVVPLHVWAGPHVFEQLGRARRSVSLATPWRLFLELLDGPLGSSATRTLISALALALFVALVWVLARLTAGRTPDTPLGTAVRWTVVLTTAYTLAAPYSLPWYDLLTWSTLPLLAAGPLDLLLLARLVAMAAAYVPGRVVGMTPAVEDLTLGVRRRVVPYAVLTVWLALAATAWRGSRPLRGASAADDDSTVRDDRLG